MLVEMKDLCKDYPQGKETVRVLKDICLSVEEGDYLAIMGPSGSGKTTLMNMIGCLDVPTSGEYLLDGENLLGASSNRLAEVRNRLLGFVFQSFYLLPKLSAVDNVALPLLYAGVPKKERRARAVEALKTMGLGERLSFKPNQLRRSVPARRHCAGYRRKAQAFAGRRADRRARQHLGRTDHGHLRYTERGRDHDRDDHPRAGDRRPRKAHLLYPRRHPDGWQKGR